MAVDLAVAGGGIAGLSCASRAMDAGLDVAVFERSSVPGGNVRTETSGGYRFELGPHTFMGSASDILSLADEAGVSELVVPARPTASRRFIVRGGRMHAAPAGVFSFIGTGLLSCGAKMTLMTEPFRTRRGDPGDTAIQFFTRRFGAEAARVLAGAFISGVYAGDPRELSAPAAFPLFWRFEQESGSMIRGAIKLQREQKRSGAAVRKGLFSFRGGLGALSGALATRLGGRLKLSAQVASIHRDGSVWIVRCGGCETRARALVLAVPPGEAAELVKPLDPELSSLLGSVPMAPVAVVHMGFGKRCTEIPDGFGFLAPRNEGVRSLGVLFPSRIFEDRAPEGGDLLAGFAGGVLDSWALDLSDGELLETVLADLKKLTGFEGRPDFLRVVRVRKAIPQFNIGHLERLQGISDRIAKHPGLLLAGNYLKGVGMKDAVASGFEAAKSAISALGKKAESP